MRQCPRCHRSFEEALYCPYDGDELAYEGGDPLMGTTLEGRYRVEALLGIGQAGRVYRGRDLVMERPVAIKVLHRDHACDPAMVARMDREARAVARIQHPHVVALFAVGRTSAEVPYLVMEYVPGTSLEDALAAGPMAPRRAVAIARDIVLALVETHGAGLVHRDLKPANVLLTHRAGRDDYVVVVDFGVATAVRPAAPDATAELRLTGDGGVLGTPHYIAPEQAQADPVDHRADLYSLGVMLYRMLTGRLPFRGSGLAVMLAHIGKAPTPPTELVGELDPRLSAIVMRCLAKQRDQRFASAEELLAALDSLDALSEDAPAPACRDTLAYDLTELVELDEVRSDEERRRRRRPPRARWLLAACAAAAAAWGATSYDLLGPGDTAPVAAAAEPATAATEPAAAVRSVARPAMRAFVVSDAGYSMRVVVPERFMVGVEYELALELWDPSDAPILAPEVVVTVARPDLEERGVTAQPTDEAGRYAFRRAFDLPGRYALEVYPPGGGATIVVYIDVVDPFQV